MNRFSKTAIVLGGYILALLLAAGTSYLESVLGPLLATQNSQGMAAFGNIALFAGVFALFCIPPTALTLWFLRKNVLFWNLAAVIALASAATGPLCEAVRTFIRLENLWRGWWFWLDFIAMMRCFGTPILALGFGLCALMAPTPRTRKTLGIAMALETATGLYVLALFLFCQRLA